MKWIKHATNCRHDTKIKMLLEEFGPHGYAAYWLIIEEIGQEFDGVERLDSLKLFTKIWQKNTFFSQKKFKTFLFFSKKIQLLDFVEDGEYTTIIIPNLLKYGDEYTRKAVKKSEEKKTETPDSVRTDSGQTPISSYSPSTSPSTEVSNYLNTSTRGKNENFENPKVVNISGGPF